MISLERTTCYEFWSGVFEENLFEAPDSERIYTVFYELVPIKSHRKPGDPLKDHYPNKRSWSGVYDFQDWLEELAEEERLGASQEWRDSFLGFNSIVGIGEVCHANTDEKYLPEKELTFLFIDFDIPVSDENTEMLGEKLKEMGIKCILIRSDFSYHAVIPELSRLDKLPLRYGKFINAFAGNESNWEWVKKIGKALIEAKDREEIEAICHWILGNVGHYEDRCKDEEVLWFPIDLRYVAHSLLEYPTLRISSKKGYDYPPYVIEKFEGRRDQGLEPVGKIISEGNVYPWMKPSAQKTS